MFGRNSDFPKGFPFSKTSFDSAAGPRDAPGQGDRATDSRQTRSCVLKLTAQNSARLPDDGTAKPIRRGSAGRNEPGDQAKIRLLPLATFVWGANGSAQKPRTRVEHCLIWVTGGRTGVNFPCRQHRLGAGDLRFIPSGTAFASLPGQDCEGYVLLVPARLTEGARAILPGEGISGHIGTHSDALLTCLRELANSSTLTLGTQLQELAAMLANLQPHGQAIIARPAAQPDGPLVERFLALARQHPLEQASLADLARELNSSVAAIDQACTAARGCRAIELLNTIRLERAVGMLRNSRDTPAMIAAKLGYSSLAHFTRSFVAATGRTPDTFRVQPG